MVRTSIASSHHGKREPRETLEEIIRTRDKVETVAIRNGPFTRSFRTQ